MTALDAAALDHVSRLVGLDSHPHEIDRNGDETSTVQNWFAGYFPRAHPRYVVVVRVTEAKTTDRRAREIATSAMNAMH
jgi:cell division protein FtsI/penicillin-binding protein 2